MRHLFIRCTGGDYYRGHTHCPFDGWSMPGLDVVLAQFASLEASLQTVDELAKLGTPPEILARVVIIEFGAEQSAFEAIAPHHFVHRGRVTSVQDVDLDLL